jgi:hypothetical protein
MDRSVGDKVEEVFLLFGAGIVHLVDEWIRPGKRVVNGTDQVRVGDRMSLQLNEMRESE